MNYSIDFIKKIKREHGLTMDEAESYFNDMDYEEKELMAEELYKEYMYTADYDADLPIRGRL